MPGARCRVLKCQVFWCQVVGEQPLSLREKPLAQREKGLG